MITEFDMDSGHRCAKGEYGWELFYGDSHIRYLDKFEEHKIDGAIDACKMVHLHEQNILLRKYLSALVSNQPNANIQNTDLISKLAEIAVNDCQKMMIMEYTNFESTLYRRFAELVVNECVEAMPTPYGWSSDESFKKYIMGYMKQLFNMVE